MITTKRITIAALLIGLISASSFATTKMLSTTSTQRGAQDAAAGIGRGQMPIWDLRGTLKKADKADENILKEKLTPKEYRKVNMKRVARLTITDDGPQDRLHPGDTISINWRLQPWDPKNQPVVITSKRKRAMFKVLAVEPSHANRKERNVVIVKRKETNKKQEMCEQCITEEVFNANATDIPVQIERIYPSAK